MTSITSPRPQIKEVELKTNEQSLEKCGWGPDCPFCKSQEKRKEEDNNSATAEGISPARITKATGKMTQDPEFE